MENARIAKPYDGALTRFVEITDSKGAFVAYVGGYAGNVNSAPVRELLAFPEVFGALKALLEQIDSGDPLNTSDAWAVVDMLEGK